MKEGGAHAVKLEGGGAVRPAGRGARRPGVPVMAHIGFTPQSEHALGGYRVQGRGDAAERLVEDALALQTAGAFAVVLEMVPADVAKRVTAELVIPTIGIGAGAGLRRAGARLAGHGRAAPGREPQVRQAVRRPGRRSCATRRARFAAEVRRRRVPGRGALVQLTSSARPDCARVPTCRCTNHPS